MLETQVLGTQMQVVNCPRPEGREAETRLPCKHPSNAIVQYRYFYVNQHCRSSINFSLNLNINLNIRHPNHAPIPLLAMTTSTDKSRYNPLFTKSVIDAIGPGASPRMREVMPALIQHLHDFAREIDLTVDEWAAGVSMVNWAGQMSTDRRNEGQLLCDVLGLES
jgi:hypothetical protein